MQKRKAFTLIELTVVILIAAVLAAIVIPIMNVRIDSARWTEGKAALGTIATALKIYASEKRGAGTYGPGLPTLEMLGLRAEDMQGKYFSISDYEVSISSFASGGTPELTYTLTATASAGVLPPSVTLDNAGNWTP
ncbi:MAG: type IV pilin protein [Planctomycetota bacterium]|jgi:prepilin-type N-terminal cleavage/methylation domain-containing protein